MKPTALHALIFVGFLVFSLLGCTLSSRVITVKSMGQPASEAMRAVTAVVSAYTASEDETDNRPWEMASGRKVYKGAVANNCYPFGTKVIIRNSTLSVEDRMNSKYGCDYWDIFMESKAEALKFGRQKLEVTLVRY